MVISTHPGRGEDYTGGKHGLNVLIISAHTTVEEDNTHGYHADELRVLDVAELQTESVAAKEHTEHKEQQQRWHAKLISGFGYKNGKKYEY